LSRNGDRADRRHVQILARLLFGHISQKVSQRDTANDPQLIDFVDPTAAMVPGLILAAEKGDCEAVRFGSKPPDANDEEWTLIQRSEWVRLKFSSPFGKTNL
jgi:hypothetical protein